MVISLICQRGALRNSWDYINYQGKLGDSSGNPLSESYCFEFSIENAAGF